MEKYIHALSWVPFFGMTAGKTPFATRLTETAIMAFVPLVAMAIWMIPKLEERIDASAQMRAAETIAYAKSLDNLAAKQDESNKQLITAITSIAVIQNNINQIEKKVDNIDDIANTKVRSIEGRLDSMERRVK